MYDDVIEYFSKKYNYYLNDDRKYRFILRLKNFENVLKNKSEKSILIWGTGTSAKLTINIIKKLYKDINIRFVVDKFKHEGSFQGIDIKNISELDNIYFDYIFICTSPGKNDAIEVMKKLNKEINLNYNFGICVE